MSDSSERMSTRALAARVVGVVGSVAIAYALRAAVESAGFAPLPAFITFYPAVMIVGVIAGAESGVAATALATLVVAYFLAPPTGSFVVASRADQVALAMFVVNSLVMNGVAHLYWRTRHRTAILEHEVTQHAATDRLRHALALAGAGAWDWDLRTNENLWSDEVWHLYGLAPNAGEPSFATWLSTVAPEDRERAAAAVQRAADAGEPIRAEWRVNLDGAEERWLLSHGDPILGPDGRPQRYAGIVLDITARRRAEERLAFAIRATGAGVFDWDVAKDELTWDDAMLRLYGQTREAFSGTPDALQRSVHPDDAARVRDALEAALRGPHDFACDFRVVWPDGSVRAVKAYAMVLRDRTGAATRMVGLNLDVTAGRRTEDALRSSLEALDAARDETRKTEEKLQQSQKMEAIGRLAGGVAHDFNNLLTVILAGAEAIADELGPGDPLRADALEIDKAAKRAAALTRQLLAFSRKQVLAPHVVDVNALLHGLEKMLRRLIGEDVELTLLLGPGTYPCLLDAGQFEQVLVNLAVNSRDAMPDGGRLTIETGNVVLDAAYVEGHPGARAGDHVQVTVTDTGAGMTADVLSHLFEPFFTTKGPGRGTGLGLSTVYGIVRQSGGIVSVYSEPGAGSCFKIYFPRTAMLATPTPTVAPSAPTARKGESILLVEDDAQVRAAVAAMLRRGGYHVIDAANGGEALLVCESHGGSIALLLTDVVMPKLNGRKVAERLKQIRPDMRVLFMSGYTENAIVHHGVLDAGVDFVAKPVNSAALLAKVRAVLDR
jgi:PAS domain S-box-containing protein